MYRIGDFSKASKTTIKTLRYYEKEGLLIPTFVDPYTGYRYYEASQLYDLSKIISLRQLGLSISDIKEIKSGEDLEIILQKRRKNILLEIEKSNNELNLINNLLNGGNMEKRVIIKTIPSTIVYYKEGKIKDFSEIFNFVLEAGEECKSLNPNLKCAKPEYCYITYLDGEYRENDITIRYSEAVEEIGNSNENIKFSYEKEIKVASLYHKGSYSSLRDSYLILLKFVEDGGYEINGCIREFYIDGCWSKESEEEYLTEIEVPIK